MKTYTIFLWACLMIYSLNAQIQYSISREVSDGGGGRAVNGQYHMVGTAGQMAEGFTSNNSYRLAEGFWQSANSEVCELENLPMALGAGVAVEWNDGIYFFGGSNHWLNLARYPIVSRFDGSKWVFYDSIPDQSVWGMEPALVGEDLYLLGGYANGNLLIRKYHIPTKTWTYLAQGPVYPSWGSAVAHISGFIYKFNPNGATFAYDISSDSWSPRAASGKLAYLGMRSVIYQDEIYITGYQDQEFHKYDPATDQWTRLSDTPYDVVGSAMVLFGGKIFCIGGSNGQGPAHLYDSIISYDIASDFWEVDSFRINSERHWMAPAWYGNKLYVIGGFDTTSYAVNIVEEIFLQSIVGIEDEIEIPTDFSLEQNYPNPFNPVTNVEFQIRNAEWVTLTVYDLLGRRVNTLINEKRATGNYRVQWDGTNDAGQPVASGVYLYRIAAGNFVETRKMLLIR